MVSKSHNRNSNRSQGAKGCRATNRPRPHHHHWSGWGHVTTTEGQGTGGTEVQVLKIKMRHFDNKIQAQRPLHCHDHKIVQVHTYNENLQSTFLKMLKCNFAMFSICQASTRQTGVRCQRPKSKHESENPALSPL